MFQTTRIACRQLRRSFATRASSPGSDPLDILLKECVGRNLCNEQGYRLPGVHWVCAIAVGGGPVGYFSFCRLFGSLQSACCSPMTLTEFCHFCWTCTVRIHQEAPPTLRTVGIQRVSPAGIDVISKAKKANVEDKCSFLHTQGHFLPGEAAEQWRGEGSFAKLELTPEFLDILPSHTVTGMVAAQRLRTEASSAADQLDRSPVESKSHWTEVVQKVRVELDNGNLSQDELQASVCALRFRPNRLEYMSGGPGT